MYQIQESCPVCLENTGCDCPDLTVYDVINAECTLTPLTCIHCGSNEVEYHQYIGDGYCGDCGSWQLEQEEYHEV